MGLVNILCTNSMMASSQERYSHVFVIMELPNYIRITPSLINYIINIKLKHVNPQNKQLIFVDKDITQDYPYT